MANIFSLDDLAQRKIYKELDFFSRVAFAYSLTQSTKAHLFRDTFKDLVEVTSLKDEENYSGEERFKYAIRMCPNLEVLRIRDRQMMENHKSISAHPKITALEVLLVEDPKSLEISTKMENIVNLSLTRHPSALWYSDTDKLTLVLKMFPNLEQLHLVDLVFTRRLLNRIKATTKVRQLSFQSCTICDGGTPRKNNKMKKLVMLGMSWDEYVLESFPKLTALTMKLDCMRTSCGAAFMINSLTKLKSLRILYCENDKICNMVDMLIRPMKIRLEPLPPRGCWCNRFRDRKTKEFVKLKAYLNGTTESHGITVLYDNVIYGTENFEQLIEKCRWEMGDEEFQETDDSDDEY